MNSTKVYPNDDGSIAIQSEGQEINVSIESSKNILIRLCSLHGWKVKPQTSNFTSGYTSLANSNLENGLIPTK
ncbi:hypothetical protein [Malaciobacter marinus]|uniref:hypothetical protein n=1 Tax=Malaciobacter marinus TaxID=505249 RepID=UPI003AFFE5C6